MMDATFQITKVSRLYQGIMKLLNQWLVDRLPSGLEWYWSCITVNKNIHAKKHVDNNNTGPSIARQFGEQKAELLFWNDGPSGCATELKLDVADTLSAFDGRRPHATAPYTIEGGDRYSVIFFLGHKHWDCSAKDLEYLDDMGFNVPACSVKAQVFSEYFHKTDFHHKQIPMSEKTLGDLNLSFWRRTGLIGDLKTTKNIFVD